jgi:hypothetical protein
LVPKRTDHPSTTGNYNSVIVFSHGVFSAAVD